MQELLFSPKTLAASLGLAEQTIYNLHSGGRNHPKAFKLGRMLRFHADDVNSWLNAKRQFDPSAAPLSGTAHPSYNGRSGEPPRADKTSSDF